LLEFRILGPFEAVRDGQQLVLGGRKPRALLAALVIHSREPLSSDRLIDLLWGEQPPPTAANTLRVHVANVRKALGSDALVTRGGGYQLAIETDAVDADRFAVLVEQARQATAKGDPAAARELLERALRMWRGQPLADLCYESFARDEIARLTEARLGAVVDRIDADLALGRHRDLVAELRALVGQHPHSERLLGQLMLALYCSGRQADALAAYREGSRRLDDQLGLEPGPELRRLEQLILDHDPALAATVTPSRSVPVLARPRRIRALVVAGGALLLAAAAAAVIAAVTGSRATGRVAADSVAVIDPATGRLIAQVGVGGEPSQLSPGNGSLWVANLGDGTVSEIDLRSRQVVRTLATETTAATTIAGVTASAGAIWTIDDSGSVRRVDLRDDLVHVASVGTPFIYWARGPDLAGSGAGAVWVATGNSSLARLDPRSGRLIDTIAVGTNPASVAVGDGGVWVSDSADDTVSHIDPASDAVIQTIPVGHGASGIAADSSGVWVANTLDDTVTRIDPTTGAATDTIPVGEGPRGVTAGAGAVWVANSRSDTISRIDPATRRVVATIQLDQSPEDVAVVGGVLFVSMQAAGPTFAPVRGALTLRMLAETDPLQSTDPAIGASDPILGGQLTYLTCGPLLNYPDRPAPIGDQLVPDVARAMPVVSDGGRIYTFELRTGVRFSSGAPVTASAFARAIERALNPKMASLSSLEVQDIVGAPAYEAGLATSVAGVSASGLRLTIHLSAPEPDFPSRIATQGFCAVPPDTAINPNGIDGIPTAGPYYYVTHIPNRVLILRRNPYYAGTRPRTVGEIVLTIGVAGNRAEQLVLGDAADYVSTVPPQAAVSLAARYGPASRAARAGSQQYFEGPLLGFSYLVLNTRRPLFAQAALRKAVNYAIDRRALADATTAGDSTLGHQPASGYLQPGVPGYEPAAIYPLGAPDLTRALRLTGALPRHGTIYAYTLPPGPQLAQLVRSELAAIGIDMDVKLFGKPEMYRRLGNANEPWDIALAGWGPDHPDPSNEINFLFDSSSIPPSPPPPNWLNNYPNYGGFSDPAFDRRMRAAATLSSSARERAYGALAIDLARDAAPVAAWAVGFTRNLFSTRIGCQSYQPIYGFDLATLCVRRPRP
jgi:YVTN family beta-propeller protein